MNIVKNLIHDFPQPENDVLLLVDAGNLRYFSEFAEMADDLFFGRIF